VEGVTAFLEQRNPEWKLSGTEDLSETEDLPGGLAG
jgi:hypothetical protein